MTWKPVLSTLHLQVGIYCSEDVCKMLFCQGGLSLAVTVSLRGFHFLFLSLLLIRCRCCSSHPPPSCVLLHAALDPDPTPAPLPLILCNKWLETFHFYYHVWSHLSLCTVWTLTFWTPSLRSLELESCHQQHSESLNFCYSPSLQTFLVLSSYLFYT